MHRIPTFAWGARPRPARLAVAPRKDRRADCATRGPVTAPVVKDSTWALGAWGLGLAAVFWPTLLRGHSLGDPGDARFVGYVLEHGLRAASGGRSFLEMPFFFPLPGVGAWSELLLPLLPLYAPWRWLGLAPEAAAQLWLLGVASLTAWAAWRLLRGAAGLAAGPAAVGTFLIAFGSPRIAQVNHQHLTGAFFALFALEAAVRWLRPSTTKPAPWLLGAGAAFALQLASGLYLGFFLALGGAVALGVLLAREDGRALLGGALRRTGAAWTAVAAVTTLGLVAPLLRVYLAAGGAHDFGVVRGYTPELHSWLHVGGGHWLYGWTGDWALFQRLPSEGEHRLGIGPVTLGLAAWALWRVRGTLAGRVVGVTVLALLLLALRWRGGFTPWQLVYELVPGAKGLRVVARVGVFMLIPWGVAVAWGLGALRRPWLALLLGAVVVLEQGRTPPHWDPKVGRAAIARVRVPAGCAAFFFDAPATPAWPFEYVQLDAMWAGLEAEVPTVNGYSGRVPEGWSFDRAPDVAGWEQRHGLAPGTVCVVGPAP